jgi:hypothetical protein
MYKLTPNQSQEITLVMVTPTGWKFPARALVLRWRSARLAGLCWLCRRESGSAGWYSYILTAAEVNTLGPLSIGQRRTEQQNLEYVVKSRAVGVKIYLHRDEQRQRAASGWRVCVGGAQLGPRPGVVERHHGRAGGRDEDGDLPCLQDATYRFYKSLSGFTDLMHLMT